MKRSDAHKHARKRRLIGRHPLTCGSLFLLGLSGYELWIRMDDFLSWAAGVRHLSEVRGTFFLQDMAIILETPEMRALSLKMGFLALTIVFSVVCIFRRRKAAGAWVMALLAGGLAAGGFSLGLYRVNDWMQAAKLIPLCMILFGFTCNGVHSGFIRWRKARKAAVSE